MAKGAIERVLGGYRSKGISIGVVLIAIDGVPMSRKAFGLAKCKWGIANSPVAEFHVVCNPTGYPCRKCRLTITTIGLSSSLFSKVPQ